MRSAVSKVEAFFFMVASSNLTSDDDNAMMVVVVTMMMVVRFRKSSSRQEHKHREQQSLFHIPMITGGRGGESEVPTASHYFSVMRIVATPIMV
jgi:hypothetical protein